VPGGGGSYPADQQSDSLSEISGYDFERLTLHRDKKHLTVKLASSTVILLVTEVFPLFASAGWLAGSNWN
jgi:hypothetical protein